MKPILFSTPMVQAILEGRKTMTRRIIKLKDGSNPDDESLSWNYFDEENTDAGRTIDYVMDFTKTYPYWVECKCPYGKIGNILWVREMLYQNGELGLEYVADKEPMDEEIIPNDYPSYRNYAFCNIPSIHMPKWACRIFLEITDIKVERLQDISEEDISKEGVQYAVNNGNVCFKIGEDNSALHFMPEEFSLGSKDVITEKNVMYAHWAELWCKINGRESWDFNPWVWAINFKRIDKPENFESKIPVS